LHLARLVLPPCHADDYTLYLVHLYWLSAGFSRIDPHRQDANAALTPAIDPSLIHPFVTTGLRIHAFKDAYRHALAYLHVTATPFVHVSKDGKASHKLAFPDQFAAQSIANFQRRTPIGRPHLTFGICTV